MYSTCKSNDCDKKLQEEDKYNGNFGDTLYVLCMYRSWQQVQLRFYLKLPAMVRSRVPDAFNHHIVLTKYIFY